MARTGSREYSRTWRVFPVEPVEERTTKMPKRPALTSALITGLALAGLAAQAADAPARIPKGLPADLWELLIPPENPVTAERVALGRLLFYERRRLS
jgi:hypothetical protein